MATRTLATERGPIVAPAEEQTTLIELGRLLARESTARPKVVGGGGEQIELPETVIRLLRQAIHELAHDQAVEVVSLQRELTTQQPADILNVSRPSLIKLLDEGTIPFTKTGTHRRVRFDDVMAFKARRDAKRQLELDALARLGQEIEPLLDETPPRRSE